MKSKTAFKTIEEFIFQGSKTFVIPDYQRGYKWAVKEDANTASAVEKLLDNLISANREQTYFLQGVTVVEEPDKIILIDGQQRTTTLYLLLWCLSEELIKNIVKENDRFLVLPPKDPQDVIGVLRESEVFFSGCETEALGISYIEALTQGAKVVMPSSGGGLEIAPNLIGKRIFLFDLSMEEECVFEALEAAVLSKNKESFDSTPFAPKTIAMQYLQLSETKKVK